MGDLAADTALIGTNGHYEATLSEDWNIWGPNGGYLAVIALRAAGRATPLRRPASFACTFLGVAEFGPIDVRVARLRESKRAAAVRVSVTQGERPILEALAWVVAAGGAGLEHDATTMPGVPGPDEVPSYDQLRRPEDPDPHPFWQNLEAREVTWTPREERRAGEPRWRGWLRFRPTPVFDDPFLEAGRSLLLIDTMGWPAAVRAHDRLPYVAPSIDVTAQFHRLAPATDWLLCDAVCPVGADGLLGGAARVWSRDGHLLASGTTHLLCRPNPAEPAA